MQHGLRSLVSGDQQLAKYLAANNFFYICENHFLKRLQ